MTAEAQSPIVIFEDADKAVEVRLDKDQDTVWLTQAQMAELFDVKPLNITLLLKNVYEEGELIEETTCKDFLQVQQEGGRRASEYVPHAPFSNTSTRAVSDVASPRSQCQ